MNRSLQTDLIKKFKCLAENCEDTCCQGWGMQIDRQHIDLYKKEAPELTDAVTTEEHRSVMRRDPKTDYCVKFEDGLCGIHKKYGDKFLGDACHFYPRVTRRFGEEIYMTGVMSCPEIARMALFGDDPFISSDVNIERLPVSLKNYAPENMSGENALALIGRFVELAGEDGITPERALARILSISKSLETQKQEKWLEAFGLYHKIVDNLLLPPVPHFADPYRLVNIVVALVKASGRNRGLRLEETISTMEKALDMRIDRQSLNIVNYAGRDVSAYEELQKKWRKKAARKMAPVLRRWLQAQISAGGFPFSGFGNTLGERRTTLAVRFATVRLALMSHMDGKGNPPDDETTVRVVQSLSRFYDHLADPKFSMLAYAESGWEEEARLRALIGDI